MIEMTIEEISELLGEARIGRLSMADRAGRPYTIPLPFCWACGTVYVRLPLTGRKGSVLRQNDSVCFEVDAFTEALDDYASVLVEGRLIAVNDVVERARVKQINDEKYERLRGGFRPGHGRQTSISELPIRKIVVTQLSGRRKERCALATTGERCNEE
jgi:nitroimidazol reductase NimA-like FMN-containing flavoprotein (pyridoxamine 5'-phosphate oxidase superfamily)